MVLKAELSIKELGYLTAEVNDAIGSYHACAASSMQEAMGMHSDDVKRGKAVADKIMMMMHTGLAGLAKCLMEWSDANTDKGVVTLTAANKTTILRVAAASYRCSPGTKLHKILNSFTQMRAEITGQNSARLRITDGGKQTVDTAVEPGGAPNPGSGAK